MTRRFALSPALRVSCLALCVSLFGGCADAPAGPAPAPAPAPTVERPAIYDHLPDMGDVGEYMEAQGRRIKIDRGYFVGTWNVKGKGYEKRGAGRGETVIDGDLVLNGSGWILSKLTITGNLLVKGNDNDVEDIEVLGRVSVRGVGNRTP